MNALGREPVLLPETKNELETVTLDFCSPTLGDGKITIKANPPYDASGKMTLEITGALPGMRLRGDITPVQARRLATHLTAAALLTEAYMDGA